MADAGDVLLVPDRELGERLDRPHPHLAILIEQDARLPAGVRYVVCDFGGKPHWRVDATLDYLRALRSLARHHLQGRELLPVEGTPILFQSDDAPAAPGGVTWQARREWPSVRLVPDIYYYDAAGYAGFGAGLPAWSERPSRFVWRGTTTGHVGMPAEALDMLPRYRLCRAANSFGRADCGFTEALQGRTPVDIEQMQHRISAEGLLRPFTPIDQLAASARFLFDIDGNANSWHFVARLRLGCCLLKVDSGWVQWYSDRLLAWTHYVPVAADLSDLSTRMDWCLKHPGEAERIANAGKRLGEEMDFEREMRAASSTLFGLIP